jgi:integration host factor subunit alpha
MSRIRDNTQKKNIVDNIFNKLGLPSTYTTKIVNDIITILISNIIKYKKFRIKNFGTFILREKKKRIGRNPKNKVVYEISERNVITFKPAESLKKKLNINVKKKY